MNVVPRNQAEKLAWCAARKAQWVTNAVAMGSTVVEATQFGTLTDDAVDAAAEAEDARKAAKDATLRLETALRRLDASAAGIVKQVRAKAETTNNPDVYTLASIPAPAIPGPVGKPGTPTALKVALKPSGAIEMTWKCANPAGCTGVIYHVYRKIESTGEYAYLGGAGMRKYVDSTLPAGVPSVMYQIQGVRSTGVGDEAEFVVNFGVSAGGPTVAAVGPKPAKIAA